MSSFQIGEAARLLGVSPDTVRRWVDGGQLRAARSAAGRRTLDGADLARFAASMADQEAPAPVVSESARNRFTGIVTRVVTDRVMAQVDIQAGPHRLVSLMSREAADQLGLAPGSRAIAAVKATNVIVELPEER